MGTWLPSGFNIVEFEIVIWAEILAVPLLVISLVNFCLHRRFSI